MKRATAKMRNFAERLVDCEASENRSTETRVLAAFRVCEKLRPNLATFMGIAGFRALLARALALAGVEVPWLRELHIKADGSLEGLDELQAQVGPDEFSEGAVVLLAQLLGLLATFIGDNLTLHLVREIWPNLSLNDLEFGDGVKNEKTT
jgi:hypothetical protein